MLLDTATSPNVKLNLSSSSKCDLLDFLSMYNRKKFKEKYAKVSEKDTFLKSFFITALICFEFFLELHTHLKKT